MIRRAKISLEGLWFFTPFVVALIFFPGCFGGEAKLSRADGYSVTTPDTWRASDRGESDRAYRLTSGSIATLTSSCNRNPDVALPILTKHLLIGAREIEYVEQTPMNTKAGSGLYSSVMAKLDGIGFQLELFVTVQNGCIFDFSLVGRKSLKEKDIKEFKNYVQSFDYGKR